MAWLSTRFLYLSRRLRRLWAVVSAHHHGSAFALCAIALMAASMATSIQGWTGLLPRPLAYAVGLGGQGFLLFFSILLAGAGTRLARLLLLSALAGFALCLSVPFSWVALVAGNAAASDAVGAAALEAQALQSATVRFVTDGNGVRAQVLTNIANARAWLGRAGPVTGYVPPSAPRLLIEELPPGGTPAADSLPSDPSAPPAPAAPAPPPTATEVQVQLRYLDELEREWGQLPLDPNLAAATGVDEGWRNLSAAYDRLMVAWGRTRRYLRADVRLPAVPARPVAGYAEAASGTADPINRAFARLMHAPRPADFWFLLLALMLDAAPIWAAWTLSLVTPSAPAKARGGEGPFELLREDLRRIEERMAESAPGSSDGARYERDATWDFALSLSVQRLFLDALETWWRRLSEAIEYADADPALEGRLRRLRDEVLAEEGERPLAHLRQARWLHDTKRALALVREAQGMEGNLAYLGPEAVEAAKRRLASLLGA